MNVHIKTYRGPLVESLIEINQPVLLYQCGHIDTQTDTQTDNPVSSNPNGSNTFSQWNDRIQKLKGSF